MQIKLIVPKSTIRNFVKSLIVIPIIALSTSYLNPSSNQTLQNSFNNQTLQQKQSIKVVNLTQDQEKILQKIKRYDHYIDEASNKYSIPDYLIKSIILHESNGNPTAISPKGAVGLMQLMPGTARDLGLIVNSKTDQRKNPYLNIIKGTEYFAKLLNLFKDEKLALSAYNAGPNKIKNKVNKYAHNVYQTSKNLEHFLYK